MKLADHRRRLNALMELRRRHLAAAEDASSRAGRLRGRVGAVEEARGVVQRVAQALQRRAHEGIAAVVNRCLEAVFDDPYRFELRFDRSRGRTECRAVFSRDGTELDDPLNEVGGGVVDVAALAIRLAVLTLARPRPRRFLALDEPFKNVRGGRNRARVRELLEALAGEFGVQMLVSTDILEFRLGTVVEL